MLLCTDEQVAVYRRKRSIGLLAQIAAGENPVGRVTGDDRRAPLGTAEVDAVPDGGHRGVVLLLQILAPERLAGVRVQTVGVSVVRYGKEQTILHDRRGTLGTIIGVSLPLDGRA